MKIHKFSLFLVIIFALITALLSAGFYTLERNLLLRTLADGLNQSIFRLEGDLHKAMQDGRWDEIQSILDQTPATNNTIAIVSISIDGKHIEASSSRSLQGQSVGEDYFPVSKLGDALIKANQTRFRSRFYYFVGAEKREATLLVSVDEHYVFGRLQHIALYYVLVIVFVAGMLSWLAFIIIQRLLVIPLEKLTLHAREANTSDQTHFIAEFTQLDHTLSDSFLALRRQKQELQSAFDESIFLDGILRTVADINQMLIATQTVEELMEKSVHRLARHQGYALCWIACENQGKLEVCAFSYDQTGILSMGMLMAHVVDDDPVSQAFVLQKSQVIDHVGQNTAANLWRTIAGEGGYGSFIAIPLAYSVHAAPIGVLGLYAQQASGFAQKEITMLEELAGDIGFAVRSFEQREQLQHHLSTDHVTGMPNRISLVDRLEMDVNVTLAIINIDRFSDINDVYGINIGDALLASYGKWLLQQIKSHEKLSLYKLGGDEYVLLFSGWDDLNSCHEFLEQLIVSSSKSSFIIEGIEILLTVTIGYAAGSMRVLEHATAAVKQAKAARQNISLYLSSPLYRNQESNIAWYKRIKSAIEDSRIVPFFQPIVDNQTRRIVKYEALIRLIEKDGTVIGPYAFLAIAKKMRLYDQLTRIMIEKTVQVFKNSTIPVSLNLSTEDLLNRELADMIEKLIVDNHVGQIVIFEILESEGIENYTEVSAFVDRFKSLGCRFAIDDFGSGYSNFDHLLKLNVDTLKIDGSLIKNLAHDRNARIFVQHIRDFAHEMGISTVAEFVANEEIYHHVKALGIDASQGYYFYEPAAGLIDDESRFDSFGSSVETSAGYMA